MLLLHNKWCRIYAVLTYQPVWARSLLASTFARLSLLNSSPRASCSPLALLQGTGWILIHIQLTHNTGSVRAVLTGRRSGCILKAQIASGPLAPPLRLTILLSRWGNSFAENLGTYWLFIRRCAWATSACIPLNAVSPSSVVSFTDIAL